MNAAKCHKCGDVIRSVHRHDFQSCKCGAIFIDGGDDYYRAGGDLRDFEWLGTEEAYQAALKGKA